MNHPFAFDPTGGYSREALLEIAPPLTEPEDFVAFWRETFAEAMGAPLNWKCTPSGGNHPAWEVFDVEYSSLAAPELKIGGWLLKPRGEPVRRGIVAIHGYAGRSAPDFAIPMRNAAVIFPCCTGLPARSTDPRLPSTSGKHVAAALFDPSVPPAGQFAVFNALAGPKSLTTLQAGHFAYEEEAAEGQELFGRLQEFFA